MLVSREEKERYAATRAGRRVHGDTRTDELEPQTVERERR
jgi:hypothetical protein